MKKEKGFWIGLLALLLYFGCQIFFLDADPHTDTSTSRGPFTDEGLNTFQARNFVNHGNWGLDEGDNLIKSPLFNAYLAAIIPLTSSRYSLRLLLVITCTLLWFLFGRTIHDFRISILLILLGGFQYHLFQFYHFSMVEMLVVLTILLGIGSGYQYLIYSTKRDFKPLLYSTLLFFSCFLLKIQYAYLLAFPFLIWLISLKDRSDKALKHLVLLVLTLAGMGTLFYLAWYLPTREVFEKVWAHQGGNRFTGLSDVWLTFKNSGKYLLWNEYNLPFAIGFLMSLPAALFLLLQSKPPRVCWLLWLSLAWLILEFHKPFILYLPTRYALSLFAAQALWMTVTAVGYWQWLKDHTSKKPFRFFKALGLAFIVPVLLGNGINQEILWSEKTTKSQQIIDHYHQMDLVNQTAVGVWATGLIWNEKVYVLPVWKNFINDDNILQKRKPEIVVTEKGEFDSGGVFKDRGINLEQVADSIEEFEYGPYQLHFYHLSY